MAWKSKSQNPFNALLFALNGLKEAFNLDLNVRLHISSIIITTFLGLLAQLSLTHWCIVVICFGLVLGMELMNSAIEKICDFVQPKHDEKIKIIKDISAAAVAVQAFATLIVATLLIVNFLQL